MNIRSMLFIFVALFINSAAFAGQSDLNFRGRIYTSNPKASNALDIVFTPETYENSRVINHYQEVAETKCLVPREKRYTDDADCEAGQEVEQTRYKAQVFLATATVNEGLVFVSGNAPRPIQFNILADVEALRDSSDRSTEYSMKLVSNKVTAIFNYEDLDDASQTIGFRTTITLTLDLDPKLASQPFTIGARTKKISNAESLRAAVFKSLGKKKLTVQYKYEMVSDQSERGIVSAEMLNVPVQIKKY